MAALRDAIALLPRGVAWSKSPDSRLGKLLDALTRELDRVEARAADLLRESNPKTTSELLLEWDAIVALNYPALSGTEPDASLARAMIAWLLASSTLSRESIERFCALSELQVFADGDGVTRPLYRLLSVEHTDVREATLHILADGGANTIVEALFRRKAYATDSLVFDWVAPAIAITSPVEAGTVCDTLVTVSGTSTGVGTVRVTVTQFGGLVAIYETTASGDGTWSVQVSLAPELENEDTVIVARGYTGIVTADSGWVESSEVTVVGEYSVAFSYTAPLTTTDAEPVLTGTATPGASIVLTYSGDDSLPFVADGSGNWSYDMAALNPLAVGTNELSFAITGPGPCAHTDTVVVEVERTGIVELLDLVSGGAFTRATVGWYQTSASALVEAAVDERRFEDFGGSEGAKLLLERQHTNSVVQSRDITGWTAGSSTTTTGNVEAGPDGAVLADRSQVSSGGFSRYRVSLPGSVGCASWWIKRLASAGSGPWQGLVGNTGSLTGKVGTATEVWQKVAITNTFVTASNIMVPADGRTVAVNAGDALTAQALDLLTDFHQWDSGVRYPRSPVVTAGSTATCNPDDLSWSSGAWDTRLATDTWTIDVWPLFASTEIVSGDVRWLLSFGGGSDGVRIRHDGTGVRVECVDGGSVVAFGPYLTFARNTRLRITIEPTVSRVTVDGVSGGAGAALTWPTAVTLRLGGIAGAAVGSGEEADARVAPPFLGEGATDFVTTTLFLGDSITVGADSTNSNGFKTRVSAAAASAGKAYRNVGPYRTGTLFDINHSGIAGNTIAQMEARISTDVTPYRPRVVVIHAGTNDLGTGVPGMQADLESLLVAVRAALPSAYLVICEIPERIDYTTQVADYNNNAIPAAVAAAGLASGTYAIVSPGVVLADIDVDGVHPLDVGHDKISAAVWAAISAWLTSIGE